MEPKALIGFSHISPKPWQNKIGGIKSNSMLFWQACVNSLLLIDLYTK